MQASNDALSQERREYVTERNRQDDRKDKADCKNLPASRNRPIARTEDCGLDGEILVEAVLNRFREGVAAVTTNVRDRSRMRRIGQVKIRANLDDLAQGSFPNVFGAR